MKTYIKRNYDKMSRQAAELIMDHLNRKPNSLVCFAAGNTPLGTFAHLAETFRLGKVSFQQCKFISLDEWVGMDGSDKGSCRQTLDEHFFKPCGIHETNIHFFDGKSENLQAECEIIDELIWANGRIDLLLLGVGMNGHLGFNEPNISFELNTHVIDLDTVTKQVSAKYFSEQRDVQRGITLGIKHLLEADAVIVVAAGTKKADIMRKALRDEVTNQVPASVLQLHTNLHVCLDEAAASLL